MPIVSLDGYARRWLWLREQRERERFLDRRGAKLTEEIVREVLYNDFIYGYDHFY